MNVCAKDDGLDKHSVRFPFIDSFPIAPTPRTVIIVPYDVTVRISTSHILATLSAENNVFTTLFDQCVKYRPRSYNKAFNDHESFTK